MPQNLILLESMVIWKYWWIYANSLEQCIDQFSLKAASCQMADRTESLPNQYNQNWKLLKSLPIVKWRANTLFLLKKSL